MIEQILALQAEGMGQRTIAKVLGITYSKVRWELKRYSAGPVTIVPKSTGSAPRILLYDIETAPAIGYIWSMWKTNVLGIKEDWYLLCFAWKWLGEDEVHYIDNRGNRNDRALATQLHSLLGEADIVIAHNGDNFDQKKANTRFNFHDLGPVSPYQSVDTLKESRRYFSQMSHSLKHVPDLMGIKQRKVVGHDFSLWTDCMAGDEKAWEEMEAYTRQDVDVLEEVYLKIRPWMGTPGKASHPNLALYGEPHVCPKCGHDDLIKWGQHRTTVSVFQTWQCKNCGGYSRSRKRISQAGGQAVERM